MGEGCHLAILVKHIHVCLFVAWSMVRPTRTKGRGRRKEKKSKSYSPLAATGSLCLSRSR